MKERIEFKTTINTEGEEKKKTEKKKGKKGEENAEIELDELPTKRINTYTVPSWAKGVEIEFDFIYDVVDFKNYFTWRENLKKRQQEAGEN